MARLGFGRRVGIGARSSVEGEFAAVGNDEGLVLFRHDHTLSFRCQIRMGALGFSGLL
jgi:hypothetical protein